MTCESKKRLHKNEPYSAERSFNLLLLSANLIEKFFVCQTKKERITKYISIRRCHQTY